MPDYKNPIDGSEYRDKQHVETALYEYRSMYVGKQYDVKRGGTIQAPSPKFTTMYMAMKNNNPNPFSHFCQDISLSKANKQKESL